MFRLHIPPHRLATMLLVGCVGIAWWGIDPRVAGLLANTALLAAATAILAMPLGVMLAVLIAKTEVPGRRAAWLLVAVMIFVPLYMVTGAWDAGFGIQGWHTLATNPHLAHEPWLSGWRGAIWVHAMAAVPWVALLVSAGLRTVERELEEDAVLRMSALRVVWHVTLRRAAAAIVVAGVWVAITTSAEIAVTDVYQVRTFAEEVYTQAALGAFDFSNPVDPIDTPSVLDGRGASDRTTSFVEPQVVPSERDDAALGVQSSADALAARLSAKDLWRGLALWSVLVLAMLWAGRRLIDDLVHAPERQPWIWRLGTSRWLAAAVMWCCLLVVAGVPLANLVFKAGVRVTATDAGRERDWSAAKVSERLVAAPFEFHEELWQSAKLGMLAATAALIVSVPLAWSIRGIPRALPLPNRGTHRQSQSHPKRWQIRRHTWRQPWGRLGLIVALLVVPGPLLGIAVIRLLNRPVDSRLAFLAALYDSDFSPWLVQTLRALPLVTLVLWPALASVPQSMLDTAATEGAGWWRRLLWIAVPQRWPALAAAWLVGLAVAIGELAATVLVVPPGPTTISVRIFSLIHYGVDDRVAAICLVVVFALAAAMLSVVWLIRSGSKAVNEGRSE